MMVISIQQFIHTKKEAMDKKERKSPKRIIINVGEELHEQIKLRAVTRRITMKEWILAAIARQVEWEHQYQ